MDTRTTNSSLIPLRWYASLFPLLIDSQFAFSTPYSFALYLSLSPFYTVWLSSTISTRSISLPRSRSISLRPVRHALDPSHAHCITDTDRMRFRREWTIVRGKSFHRIRARFISIEGNVTKRESVSFWAYRYARVGRIHIYIYISRCNCVSRSCVCARGEEGEKDICIYVYTYGGITRVFSGSSSPLSKNSGLGVRGMRA